MSALVTYNGERFLPEHLVVEALAQMYAAGDQHKLAVATLCDDVLDPSGRLLGLVRYAAVALLENGNDEPGFGQVDAEEGAPAPTGQSDHLVGAEATLNQIGGFNGNDSFEIAPVAQAAALIGIGFELRRIADALGDRG